MSAGPEPETRSLILMNHLGHLEIQWSKESDAEMRAVIAQKIGEGYAFYAVKPPGQRGQRKKIRTIHDLEERRIHVPDEHIYELFAAGKIAFERRDINEQVMQEKPDRLTDPAIIAASHAVAVAPRTGG